MLVSAEVPRKPVPSRQHGDHAEKDGTEQIVCRRRSGEERGVCAEPGDLPECGIVHRTADVGRRKKARYARFTQCRIDIRSRRQIAEIEKTYRNDNANNGPCARDQECAGHARGFE